MTNVKTILFLMKSLVGKLKAVQIQVEYIMIASYIKQYFW